MVDVGIEETVEIPEGIDTSLDGNILKISGPNGELSRTFDLRGISLEEGEDCIVVKSESSRKKRRAAVGTVVAHVENMIKGVTEGFESRLKVVYSHFPISVDVRDDRVEVENFIGEEEPRVAKIVGKETEVNVNGEEIEVRGPNKEEVGQTAANIEQSAQVRGRDPRVFQDGVYIVEKV